MKDSMSIFAFLKSMVVLPVALHAEPLTTAMLKALKLKRILFGLPLLIVSTNIVFNLATSGVRHTALETMTLGLSLVAWAFGLVILLKGCIDSDLQPITQKMCTPLLAACSVHPSIEAYRFKVSQQHRTFVKGEYDVLMAEAERLSPERAAQAAAEAAACRELHGIA